MKRYLRYSLALLLICFLAAGLFPGRAEAATANKALLSVNCYFDEEDYSGDEYDISKSCSADLTGDGKADTVKLKFHKTEWDFDSFKIYVNGKLAYTMSSADRGLISGESSDISSVALRYVKLSNTAEYLDLAFKSGKSDIFRVLLKYNSSTKKLELARNLIGSGWGAAAARCSISSVSSGYMYVTYHTGSETYAVGPLCYKIKLSLKDGKLSGPSTTSKVSSELLPDKSLKDGLDYLFAENLFQCAKKLSFKTKAGGSTTAFTAKRYTVVKFTKLTAVNGKLYGYFSNGTSGGWLKISGLSSVGYDYDAADVGETGYFRGVGSRLR